MLQHVSTTSSRLGQVEQESAFEHGCSFRWMPTLKYKPEVFFRINRYEVEKSMSETYKSPYRPLIMIVVYVNPALHNRNSKQTDRQPERMALSIDTYIERAHSRNCKNWSIVSASAPGHAVDSHLPKKRPSTTGETSPVLCIAIGELWQAKESFQSEAQLSAALALNVERWTTALAFDAW